MLENYMTNPLHKLTECRKQYNNTKFKEQRCFMVMYNAFCHAPDEALLL